MSVPSLSSQTASTQNSYITLWPHKKGNFHQGHEKAWLSCFEKQELLLILIIIFIALWYTLGYCLIFMNIDNNH